MDLSLFKVKDSITVEIIHPDLEGVSFEMAGPSHPQTIQANRDLQDKMGKTRRKNLTADELTSIGNEMLAMRTLSWKGIDWEGTPLECNHDNALMILSNKNLSFVTEQISRAMGDTESFFVK